VVVIGFDLKSKTVYHPSLLTTLSNWTCLAWVDTFHCTIYFAYFHTFCWTATLDRGVVTAFLDLGSWI